MSVCSVMCDGVYVSVVQCDVCVVCMFSVECDV